MGPDPDVVAHGDALTLQRLTEHLDIGVGHRVIEAEDGRVRSDAHTVAESDLPADDRVRVHAAIAPGYQAARDVCARSDIRPVAEVEFLILDGGRVRDEAVHAETVTRPRSEIRLQRPLPLLRGGVCVAPEVPGRELEGIDHRPILVVWRLPGARPSPLVLPDSPFVGVRGI